MKIYIYLASILPFLLISNSSFAQYTYQKPVEKYSPDVDHISKFEVGFHYGPAWTLGGVKEFAKSGSAFSLDLGVNSGHVYVGTEFTITSWKDYYDTGGANELNFEQTNFLWLVNAKYLIGEGKVQAYFGMGTDLISLAIAIIVPEDDDDCYYSDCYDDDRILNYNAWFVPSFGIRWKMGPKVSGDIGFSANFSDNYDSLRLQVGIVF
ncbi:hypothetical protein [Labilibaculum antarcticum]|uniref:Outer membrane protein beta-barrel domain-containing protein n=1 Tax=Labilibaculum antarcticum TaxID=1717717 RepID=A0A1Y1CEG7_9BACT|nr:hypothetical protein [Labilibaculum antarcticum]BAX78759.1 hypothetical protein ALGA_0364 [Labilibaculum antarcticum]